MNLRRAFALLTAVAVLAFAFAPSTARAQDADDADPPVERLTLGGLLRQGGWAMWPLGLCSLTLVAFAVFNFMQLSGKKLMPPDALARIKEAAGRQDVAGVWEIASTTPSLFTQALASGLRKMNPEDLVASKTAMEEGIMESVVREEQQVSFWINFLSLVASIAPMIGLLGTVSGMIGAFQKIGQGGMGKPELLASNIGEALITTATGLVIAIPALFFYFLFKNLLNRTLIRAEEQFSIVLDDLTGTRIEGFEAEA